jgi:4-hydroxybenzoate polyprenyltransferase
MGIVKVLMLLLVGFCMGYAIGHNEHLPFLWWLLGGVIVALAGLDACDNWNIRKSLPKRSIECDES